MKFNELYQYVFEGRAVPDARKSNEQQARVKKKIQDTFEQLFTGKAEIRFIFIQLLNFLNTDSSIALKNIIITPNEEKELSDSPQPPENFCHPDTVAMQQAFADKNAYYQFFNQEAREQAEKDYIEFVRAYKLVADFIEQNNDAENSLVFDNAYKMLVTCGATHKKNQSLFKDVLTYLNQHGAGNKPVHDAFLKRLPRNNPPLQDMAGWRRLIQKYGSYALDIFQEAPAIESILKHKAPTDKKQAQEASSKVLYKNADQHLELARLCKQYHLAENIFDTCLKLEKRRKTSDLLPDIHINGDKHNAPGYHLLKLPVNDPRAYILGHITNCCQSIGGHSERCVIDGVTLETNSFYVLLKGKKNISPLKRNGQINYDQFRIVGQGYAWLSKDDNLVFDSWENLMQSNDDIIVTLLKVFAKKTINQNQNMMRVTIGTGGKSPEYYKALPRQEISEQILKGYAYGDSREQALIYFDEQKWLLLKDGFEKSIINTPGIDDLIKKEIINFFCGDKDSLKENENKNLELYSKVSCKTIDALKKIFTNKKFAGIREKYLAHESSSDFLNFVHQNRLNLILLNTKNKLTPDTIEKLYKITRQKIQEWTSENGELDSNCISKIGDILTILYLSNPELLDIKFLNKYLKNSSDLRVLGPLKVIYETSPSLVTEKNLLLFDLLLTRNKDFRNFNLADIIADLYKTSPEYSTYDNHRFAALFIQTMQKGDGYKKEYNKTILEVILELNRLDSSLILKINPEYFISNKFYTKEILKILAELYKANPELVCEMNVNWLLKNLKENGYRQSLDCKDRLIALDRSDPNLLTDENLQLISKCSHLGGDCVKAIQLIHQLDIDSVAATKNSILTADGYDVNSIFKILLKFYHRCTYKNTFNKVLVEDLSEAIRQISNVDSFLINSNMLKLLSIEQKGLTAVDMANSLIELYNINSESLSDKTLEFLDSNFSIKYELLKELSKRAPRLIISVNYDLLGDKIRNSWGNRPNHEIAKEIADILIFFMIEHPELNTENNIKFCLSRIDSDIASKTAQSILKLHKENPELVPKFLSHPFGKYRFDHLDSAEALIILSKGGVKDLSEDQAEYIAKLGESNSLLEAANAFIILYKNKMLFQDVKEYFAKMSGYLEVRAKAWVLLYKNNLLSTKNIYFVQSFYGRADDAAQAIISLDEANSELLKDEILLNVLRDNRERCLSLVHAICALVKANINITSYQQPHYHVRSLVECKEYALDFAKSLVAIVQIDDSLAIYAGIKFERHPAELKGLDQALIEMNNKKSGIITEKSLDALSKYFKHAWIFTHALQSNDNPVLTKVMNFALDNLENDLDKFRRIMNALRPMLNNQNVDPAIVENNIINDIEDHNSALYKVFNHHRNFIPLTFFGPKHFISSDTRSIQELEELIGSLRRNSLSI